MKMRSLLMGLLVAVSAQGAATVTRADTVMLVDIMLPTKLLEYMRLGIPVAVSWTPTIARYVREDAVFFIQDLVPEEVARVINEALSDPEGARDRARRAQDLPIAQSWQENEQFYVDTLCGD